MKIVEKRYRGSVICRALSYPIAYAITKMLLHHGSMTLSEIVKKVERSKAAVCFHMAKLRTTNIVRYEKKGRETIYWIKYPKHIQALLDACEALVTRTTQRIERDI
jgi:ArsR family transcriptional regulator